MLMWPISAVLGFEISTAYQDTAPKFMLDEQGQATGICVDIFAALEKQDPQLVFTQPNYYTPLKRIFYAIETGSLMAYCGAGYNKIRAGKMLYSQVPLYRVSTRMLISRENDNPYPNIQALKNDADLGFYSINGTSTHNLLIKMGFKMHGHYVKTLQQGLGLALSDSYNVFVYHSLGLNYALAQNTSDQTKQTQNKNNKGNKWQGLKLIPISLRDYQHWMVFSQKIKKAPLKRINDALKKLREQKVIDKIIKKYQ